ncbi:unnamed protein product [Hymenolepis diminuta]|uniref:WW domain-containing protein n=1 Tax=Hymenolepis diminuta TaxID=6216 RepID=A0A0R3SRR9_HYMDI|nr:unnamed protein product [Hymenolepis diminuta]
MTNSSTSVTNQARVYRKDFNDETNNNFKQADESKMDKGKVSNDDNEYDDDDDDVEDDEDNDDDFDDDDDADEGNLGLSKKVLWAGPQTYNGYYQSRYRNNGKTKSSFVSDSRLRRSDKSSKPKERVNLEETIQNKNRKYDSNYRQGLQEFADLM